MGKDREVFTKEGGIKSESGGYRKRRNRVEGNGKVKESQKDEEKMIEESEN